MVGLDYLVLFGYVFGILAVGAIFSRKIHSSVDLFAAGGQSPWWMSGMSAFMTMFSAGTFVVWGRIAYESGMVAVSINLCYGVSALFVGYFVAGQWRKLGVTTAAEYVQLRFGNLAVQFYTWLSMFYKMITVAVSLYSIAVLLCALMPLKRGHILIDSDTGNLSVLWATLLCGVVVVAYTVAGGLWAVLMNDVLQFIVLSLSVLIVLPLSISKIGIGRLFAEAPDGFLLPTTSEYTWWFLFGWVAIHFFKIGGEWAFAQRFICVPTAKDAKKASYLFGVLYLTSAFIWMLPPMLYRFIDPNANPEQAYILACQSVLPPRMIGLVLAAMFAATASMIDSELNVFAGVLTRDIYRPLLKPQASEKYLVKAGRVITVLLGGILIALALAVPHVGGAKNIILIVTSLLVVPLVLPTVWGLYSRKAGQNCVWLTAGITCAAGILIRFGLCKNGFLANIRGLQNIAEWVQANTRSTDIFIGVILPLVILFIIELFSTETNQRWLNLKEHIKTEQEKAVLKASTLPARIVAYSIGILGTVMAALAFIERQQWHILVIFSVGLFVISGVIGLRIRKSK